MLIAEDLLLLLTHDQSGKLAAESNQVDVALGGAMLIELTLMDRVDIAGPGEEVREGRLVVRDASPTSDPFLDEALSTLGKKHGKRPRDVVAPLGRKLRGRLYDRLVERGILRAESGKILGIFPTHRWPAQDAAHEGEVRASLDAALRNGVSGDDRVAALVSLLHALKAVHKVVDPATVGLSKKEMNANAKRIAEGDWASEAVRKAIDGMNAAVIAAVGAGAIAAGSS